jgi:ABC transporter substrate binding protein
MNLTAFGMPSLVSSRVNDAPDFIIENPLCSDGLPAWEERMQFGQLRRREFIMLLGGVAAWPLVARAQQGERVRRVGVLAGGTATGRTEFAAFQQALEQLGWSEGRNLRIEYRWGAGDAANTRKHVEQLVALAPDVIVAVGASPLAPLLQATRDLPIVFVSVSTRSAPALSRACRGRVPTPPASRSSNTAWPASGCSCSRRSRHR